MADPAKKLHLKIITPEKVKFSEDVDMVIMRCLTGDMGILPDHEACTALLDYAILRMLNNGEERKIVVHGGFAEVRDNDITILTDASEWPEDIDRERAERARKRAEQRLHDKTEDVDLQNDQIALRRSLVRIEVSSYPLVSGRSSSGKV